ncbi:MAG: RDD family protein [Candidatus Sulfotelmatobacter sp.]
MFARLNRYRARRKIRPPRYPSLHLEFGAGESPDAPGSSAALLSAFDPVSDQALALDGMRQRLSAADPDVTPPQEHSTGAAPQPVHTPAGYSGAKILEFPRLGWAPPAPPSDQLAEPVIARPRILEVPEVAPEPPALGGITMDAAERKETGKQPGIDIPLQSASLGRRILAGAIDGLIVAIATALFGAVFWKVAGVRPPLIQMLSLAAGTPCLFWAGYQYLLIVYAASTPGLRVAGLELCRFDGAATSRSLRRWRVLASYLSGASLGMGFAWAFLDEDALCWHDRITHTYLSPQKRSGKKSEAQRAQ